MANRVIVDTAKVAASQEFRELEQRLSTNKVSVCSGGLYIRTLTDARLLASALSACGDSLAAAKLFMATYKFEREISFDPTLFTPLKTEPSKIQKIARAISDVKGVANIEGGDAFDLVGSRSEMAVTVLTNNIQASEGVKALMWLLCGAPLHPRATSGSALPPSSFSHLAREDMERKKKTARGQDGEEDDLESYEMRIMFPKKLKGLIIGKGGAGMKELEDLLGEAPTMTELTDPTTLTLTGTEDVLLSTYGFIASTLGRHMDTDPPFELKEIPSAAHKKREAENPNIAVSEAFLKMKRQRNNPGRMEEMLRGGPILPKSEAEEVAVDPKGEDLMASSLLEKEQQMSAGEESEIDFQKAMAESAKLQAAKEKQKKDTSKPKAAGKTGWSNPFANIGSYFSGRDPNAAIAKSQIKESVKVEQGQVQG